MSHLSENSTTTYIDLSQYKQGKNLSYLVKRFLWSSVQLPFWPKMPRRLSPLRVFLLRLFGAKIGHSCLIASGARIWVPWNLEMGNYAVIGDNVDVYNLAPIEIGDNTVISQYSYLCTATHDYTKSDFPLYANPIKIGSSVWIAARVFVAPAVNINDGAVIGACSVVTKDVPAWTVCVGNPCHPLKARPVVNEN